jgi:hypothetical protein
MNIEKDIHDFSDKLQECNELEKKDFILNYCRANTAILHIIVKNVFFKLDLFNEIKFLFEDEELLPLLDNQLIKQSIYYQRPEIVTLFINYDMINVNDYKEPYINKALNLNDIDFLKLIIDNVDNLNDINYHFFTIPIMEENKAFLKLLLESDKIVLNKDFLHILTSAFNLNLLDIISWLLDFDKVLNLCSSEWSNGLHAPEQKKFFSFILSIKTF